MLFVILLRTNGKIQMAESCKYIPDDTFLYKTIPIKSPQDRYKGINKIDKNKENLIEE